MVTKDLEEKSLRELILAFDDGLSVYDGLNKDFVPIKVSFSQCTYMTAVTAIEELMTYVANLDRDICREPLCLDLDEMGSEDYWMEKLAKTKSDMVELEDLPLLQKDLVWGYKGFYPQSTTELYQGIEQKTKEVAGLLRQIQQKMDEKPLSFYNKFYHDQRAQYCEEQAVKDFKYWLTHSGIPSLVKLRTLRAQVIADFINGGMLKCATDPSVEEWEKVNVEQFKKQLPLEYGYAEWFDVCYTIFNRTIGWQGDILIPNYDCAGLFIFQHWAELTPEQINSIFYLDKMLEQIHAEVLHLPETEAEAEPAAEFSRICNSAARNGEFEIRNSQPSNSCVPSVASGQRPSDKFDGTEDIRLSALFREECYEELKMVIDSWRPHLKDVDPDEDALCLSTFHFDLDQIQPSTVYLDFARLISQGALMVPMSNLAAYMFSHSNLSKSENALYVQLKRYKKMCGYAHEVSDTLCRRGAMVPDPIAPLIKEPQHPEGELGTVGHIPVVGEDVGVFHSSYLREILAATANLEGIFPIHLEIALCLSVFHVI